MTEMTLHGFTDTVNAFFDTWVRFSGRTVSDDAQRDVRKLFLSESLGKKLIEEWDALLSQYPELSPLGEFMVDLLTIKMLVQGQEAGDIDFTESAEWEEVEELLEDRGTELLSLLMYLSECRETNHKPDLESFLFGFLIDEDDDYQDELFIYEPLVSHQDLPDAGWREIVNIGNGVDEDWRDLFTPLMLFFGKPHKLPQPLLEGVGEASSEPGIHTAIWVLLNRFFNGNVSV